ncbi:hypothetical protein LRS05_05080 [Flavobacterium sp. J372]|uniref:hypothetical protein n=1 Tax=Flavobacterium sp. J372 TaxID=2898436 RepID=UPI0021519F85|nr:hypothetical protein [Flavobacterium sp. J372]MCR5861551.1 hypothetical protein [Flavobacterium sp. J372]
MNEQPAEGSATITKISFSQIKNDPKHRRVAGTVDEFKESIKLKHSSTGRLVYNEEYGFYIDEENGIYIEDGEKHSYTFRIERPETGEKIENIVFSPDGNGGYRTMLVKYDIKSDEFYTLTEDELKEREAQLALYDPTAKDFSIVICDYVWKFHYKERDEREQWLHEPGYWYKEWDCQFIGGGGGGSSGGSGGVGGGGSSGGGGNGPACCGGGGSGSGGVWFGEPAPPIVTTPIPKTYNPYKIKLDPLLMHNYKCQSQIIIDVHNACSGLNDAFLNIFEGLGTHNVTYFNSPNMSSNGHTTFPDANIPISGNPNQIFNFEIELRNSFLNTATDLAIARTVIHENVHALLLYLKHTNNIVTMNENPTYEQLLTAYVDKKAQMGYYTFPTNNDIHHEFMIQFIDDIKETLKAYGQSKGYNLPDNYYYSMAWGGLHDTATFNVLFPPYVNLSLNPARVEIIGILVADQNNQTQYDLNGNSIVPQGVKCTN